MLGIVYTPDNIWTLGPSEVFVFGSNHRGIHGAGAAKLAHEKFGARWGVGEGPTGQCYALPTKDLNIESRKLEDIAVSVDKFLDYAQDNREKIFLVTAVGTGLAGFTAAQIAPLFFRRAVPINVRLPRAFWEEVSLFELP